MIVFEHFFIKVLFYFIYNYELANSCTLELLILKLGVITLLFKHKIYSHITYENYATPQNKKRRIKTGQGLYIRENKRQKQKKNTK